MLGSVRGVRKGFAALIFAKEWFFSGVASVVNFQIFKTGKTPSASILLTTVGLLPSMHSHVSQQLVLGVERLPPSWTGLPEARKIFTSFLVFDMICVDMLY